MGNNTKKDNKKEPRTPSSITIINLIVWSMVLWLLPSAGLFLIFFEKGTRERATEIITVIAQIGDSFGAINALFSGLALAGVVYTIVLQRKLSNQQSFENKFFQLLNLHHTIVSGSGENLVELFKHISMQIKQNYEKKSQSPSGCSQEDLVEIYNRNYKVHHALMGHYFRNLYHIVKYIHESNEIDDKEKERYIKILRAQLSAYEIVLLAYNGLTEIGKGFKQLIIDYKLLNNLDSADDVAGPDILKRNYEHLENVMK
ncbi:putative phage abortive infection protein [Paenibacillus sp. FSL H7-0350]|uniref:putative phage abortive infection protein n=1 Tax=Paenibacillus sp. FSL H7-0350 TaxID=2975345 RepID=UPI0031583786